MNKYHKSLGYWSPMTNFNVTKHIEEHISKCLSVFESFCFFFMTGGCRQWPYKLLLRTLGKCWFSRTWETNLKCDAENFMPCMKTEANLGHVWVIGYNVVILLCPPDKTCFQIPLRLFHGNTYCVKSCFVGFNLSPDTGKEWLSVQ